MSNFFIITGSVLSWVACLLFTILLIGMTIFEVKEINKKNRNKEICKDVKKLQLLKYENSDNGYKVISSFQKGSEEFYMLEIEHPLYGYDALIFNSLDITETLFLKSYEEIHKEYKKPNKK